MLTIRTKQCVESVSVSCKIVFFCDGNEGWWPCKKKEGEGAWLPAKPTWVTSFKLPIEEISRVHSTTFALWAENCTCSISQHNTNLSKSKQITCLALFISNSQLTISFTIRANHAVGFYAFITFFSLLGSKRPKFQHPTYLTSTYLCIKAMYIQK